MLLRLAAALIFLGFSLPASAQCVGSSFADQLTEEERSALARATDNIPFAQGLLWAATKNDQTITIAGTMHIYDPRLEPIRDRLRPIVQSADLILLEATPAEEAALQALISTDPDLLFINEGPTLPDILDQATWALIAEAATARMIPGFMAAKMRPWYLSMMLAIPPCAISDLSSGARGLDHMIMDDATAANVPLQALEDPTTLFEIFQKESVDEQIDMLRINLLSEDMQREMFVAMLDHYFAGDIGRVWELSRLASRSMPDIDPEEAMRRFAKTEQSLLIDRNRNWMPVIAQAASAHKNLVIAVGAAHLIGRDGVLQFLQDEGWTLNPL